MDDDDVVVATEQNLVQRIIRVIKTDKPKWDRWFPEDWLRGVS
jgi:hypothetical protein